MYWLYVITFCLIAWLLVVEHISKVRQPLPNFEAIYILTPEETVSHKIHNMYQLKRPTHCIYFSAWELSSVVMKLVT